MNVQSLYQRWLGFWALEDNYHQRLNFKFIYRVLAIFLGYVVVKYLFLTLAVLPFDSYLKPVIALEYFQEIIKTRRSLLFLPILAFLIIFFKPLSKPWTSFQDYKPIRLLVILSVILLSWVYSTYDYNLLFNQPHFIDRFILLAFIFLIWWRPAFSFLYVLILMIVIHQFEYLGKFTWTIPNLPIHIIMLFCSYYIFKLLTKSEHFIDFFFALGVILISHYWFSGWSKVNKEWLLHDNIFYLLAATHPNGWLAHLSEATIGQIIHFLSPFNAFFRVLIITIEVGSILFFIHRKFTRLILLGFVCFHIGVFLASGIFFWIWSIIDIALLIILWRYPLVKNGFPFKLWHIGFFILLVLSSRQWSGNGILFWHDSPLSYTCILEGVTENGDTVRLPTSYFSPYDYDFTMGRFHFVDSVKTLPIAWGATDRRTSAWFRTNHPTKEEIFEYEKERGSLRYDEKRKKQFEYFLSTWGKNWNNRLSKNTVFSYIQSPAYLVTYPKTSIYKNPQKLKAINVVQLTNYYKDGKFEEIRRKHLRQVEIPVE